MDAHLFAMFAYYKIEIARFLQMRRLFGIATIVFSIECYKAYD